MSFRCQHTGRVMPPGTPSVKVVVAVRPVEHPTRDKADKRRVNRKRRVIQDRGGKGTQVAQELTVCPAAALELAKLEPRVEAALPPRKPRLQELEEQLYGVDPAEPARKRY